jgi:hypothetical protein
MGFSGFGTVDQIHKSEREEKEIVSSALVRWTILHLGMRKRLASYTILRNPGSRRQNVIGNSYSFSHRVEARDRASGWRVRWVIYPFRTIAECASRLRAARADAGSLASISAEASVSTSASGCSTVYGNASRAGAAHVLHELHLLV